MTESRTLYDDTQGGPFSFRVVQAGEEGPEGHDSSETGDWTGMHKPQGVAEGVGCLRCNLPDEAETLVHGFIPIELENWYDDINHRLMMLHRCNIWQKGMNADKLDCWDLDDILDWTNTQLEEYLRLDGTSQMTGKLKVISQPDDAQTSIYAEGDATTGIRIDALAGEVSITINEVAELTVADGKVTIPGLLDPIGLEYTQTATNPGDTAANTNWISTADGRLRQGSEILAYQSDYAGFIIGSVTEKTTDFTAAFGKSYYLSSGSSKTATLPTITATDVGKIVEFINRSGSPWTVDGAGSNTAEGVTTLNIGNGSTIPLRAISTTEWVVI